MLLRRQQLLGRSLLHSSSRVGSQVKLTPAKSTTQTAVNDILYNFPPTSQEQQWPTHTLSVLVDNQVGVLSKVTGMLSSRGFNIESLAVSKTNVQDLSRMTVVLKCPTTQLVQAQRQLEDLFCVWGVLNLPSESSVQREFLLCKLDYGKDSNKRQEIAQLVQLFGGRVVDVGTHALIVETVGSTSQVDALLELLQPFSIVEAVRSGSLAMAKCKVATASGSTNEERDKLNAAAKMDEMNLPPG